ncbi:uncharacterized protein STEHIDRAFT_150155 [Stereum hirsutum FP-91666 SS1]|uniref:uncharacterized protein n=1 Tax=Stereum hirsutum (strain FP-91666) TaxID=721885 RepID=UPI00044492D3|nr:uncharacterized protein STEHIDRAFT_150155 [Stereum hirsutum FP-91666 SS1]EIM81130.1 hypothetical protein STEHIDRAFT_150155 [Stereum hirsutum FP-91666 SS1]
MTGAILYDVTCKRQLSFHPPHANKRPHAQRTITGSLSSTTPAWPPHQLQTFACAVRMILRAGGPVPLAAVNVGRKAYSARRRRRSRARTKLMAGKKGGGEE